MKGFFMGKLRFLAALWAAKLSIVALKITRHNGTNFPGVLALRICPDFMKYIGKPEKGGSGDRDERQDDCQQYGSVDAFAQDGISAVNNRMSLGYSDSGIATSLIQNCGLSGKRKKVSRAD